MSIEVVGVVGCGAMGSGIAQVVLQAGYRTVVAETGRELLDQGLASIRRGLEKACEKGKLEPEHLARAVGSLSGSTSLSAFAECDLVIEAAFEDLQVKRDLFAELDRECKPETVLATNTSSLCVTELAAATKRPARCVGLHFFNPPTVMPLVEVVRTLDTEREVLQAATEFVGSLGKVQVAAQDRAGFIVNLFLTPFLLDAIRGVGQGVASVRDIDAALKFGCNHPMGPLMLADFIGLDLLFAAGNRMFEEYRESRYAPPPLLRRLVTLGQLGNKTGRGFYDWSDAKNPVPRDLTPGSEP